MSATPRPQARAPRTRHARSTAKHAAPRFVAHKVLSNMVKPSRSGKTSRREAVEDRCAPSLHHAHDAVARLLGAPVGTTDQNDALVAQLQGTSLFDAQQRGTDALPDAETERLRLESNASDEAEWAENPRETHTWYGERGPVDVRWRDGGRATQGKPKRLAGALRIQERAIAKARRKSAAPKGASPSFARELEEHCRGQEVLQALRRLGLPTSAERTTAYMERISRKVHSLDQQLEELGLG